ncbi:prostaglandin E2 receptor EP3 subtype [Planococcus citri]|uniref:prostaglandin E2 receptor EP3 subtype n=1 Tax=Planococcus citri TaxID=170843 RepID=UPI0031F7B053
MANYSINFTENFHSNESTRVALAASEKHLSNTLQIIITTCYVVGILGNLFALAILCKKTTRPSNPKYRLMLKCLSVNDLTALTGMLILMYMHMYYRDIRNDIWYCRARVIWRVFGLGSGCVAFVMAVERWLALTKPFVYQKHVTVVLIRRAIFGLWISAVILACMPFFGFGLYYDEKNPREKCRRYRHASAEHTRDVVYAYLYFSLGMLLVVCLVFCNIAVMRSLCYKGTTQIKIREQVSMRRMSRSVSKMSTSSTREEIAFGRLMGFLCIIFVICWVPQMLTIPLAACVPHSEDDSRCKKFFRLADILMALHFVLDPYVYVVQRLPTIRNFFCSHKLQLPQYKPSIRMSSYDSTPSFYIAKI